jgi:D-mannonate dehydratase
MYKLMKVLCDHNYKGTITLDHTPVMADGENLYAPHSYATGYMRALAERAIVEGKK